MFKVQIKEAKKLYYNTKIIKSPNRIITIWNIVNHLAGKNKVLNEIYTIKDEDCVIEDQYKISQLFNEYFLTTAEKLNTIKSNKPQIVPMNNLLQTFSKPIPKIIVKNITTTEIEKIIKCLKPSNSHGYDKISTKILKYSFHMISSPLTYLHS
jgi:hypothetical protein